jgi:shikimate dehydrogenase
MTRAYAEVIGDPVDQSLSPTIHGFWLKALSIDASYERRRVTRPELPAYLAEKRADPAWRGSNVAMPLKLDAVTLADGASDRAVACRRGQSVMMRNVLAAANTDAGAIATCWASCTMPRADGQRHLAWQRRARRAALVALKLVEAPMSGPARDLSGGASKLVEFGLETGPAPLRADRRRWADQLLTPLGMPGSRLPQLRTAGYAGSWLGVRWPMVRLKRH